VNDVLKYIESKNLAWSDTTKRSEGYRLRKHARALSMAPKEYYDLVVNDYKPYALKTLFIRLSEYELFARHTTKYKEFLKSHARLFKHAYKKELLNVTFTEALARIETIGNADHKAIASYLLRSGLRYSELRAVHNGFIRGKGGKQRPLFLNSVPSNAWKSVTYNSFYKSMCLVGLKPHTLRKLFVTRILESGLALKDVAYIAGHSSIETTMRYAQPKDDATLTNQVTKALELTT